LYLLTSFEGIWIRHQKEKYYINSMKSYDVIATAPQQTIDNNIMLSLYD